MAWTEIYVDPSIAADSGAGTIGDPYGDLEYAIEQETFDLTNGTRVNIKAGTDEILAAELSLALEDTGTSIAWAPAFIPRLIFEGYTATAGDGGQGGISGGGSVAIYDEASGKDHITFKNLHLHNVGANWIVRIDDHCAIINCELDGNPAGAGGLNISNQGKVIGNYIHNVNGPGISCAGDSIVAHNIIVDGANTMNTGIIVGAVATTVYRNIISCTATMDGISTRLSCNIINNSIYSAGGTGQGIITLASQPADMVTNNLVEGFSGVGGIGFDLDAATTGATYFSGNAVYDCTTAYTTPTIQPSFESDNETLSASPFTDAAGGDFSPVDTGNVKEGSLPATWQV